MLSVLQYEYQKLGDDELLRLASDRSSLTDEAKLALDAEMHRRNLTVVDVTTHEDFVKRSERRESKRTRRKLFGTRRGILDWVRFGLFALLAFSVGGLVAIWLAERGIR